MNSRETRSDVSEVNESRAADRVREHTDPQVLHRLDAALRDRVLACVTAGPDALTRRIDELEAESDIERLLEINASALALGGLAVGVFKDRRLLAVPAVVLGFLLQHGIQGWCPPVPIFRRLGVRTRQEIDSEMFALKALRGDFEALRVVR